MDTSVSMQKTMGVFEIEEKKEAEDAGLKWLVCVAMEYEELWSWVPQGEWRSDGPLKTCTVSGMDMGREEHREAMTREVGECSVMEAGKRESVRAGVVSVVRCC